MLRGSIVALVTPMLPSGDIDWVSLAALVEYHVDAGTRGQRILNNGRETIYDSLPGRNGHRHGQAWHRQ